MIRRVVALALVFAFCDASLALGWDPLAEEGGDEGPAPSPDPVPFIAPPPGIYYVTDTYVADVVTTSGPLTAYTTATVHESTGSYARVLGVVATGEGSAYDGAAFNGRRALRDGHLVAGTYYENYVLTEAGFVPVSIVFFQDDAEFARLEQRAPPGSERAAPPPETAETARERCCSVAGSRVTPNARPSAPEPRSIQPGISLHPAGAPLTRIEVLRGRAVELWLRAFVDSREIPVRTWAVAGGEFGDALATSGSGAVPFRTSWSRLAPPGTAHELVFRLEIETPETGRRVLATGVAITVRSPALED